MNNPMNKQEFLNSLKENLERYQIKNIQDILADYEEHFVHGLNKGKREDEISESLGTPSTIAKAYQTESMINEIKNPQNKFRLSLALNIVIRLLVIAPLNFFVLFIPGILLFAFLVTGWSISAAIASGSLAILSALPSLATLPANAWTWIAGLCASFSLLGLGVLGGMIMFLISKTILIMLISYLQWNLKFVMEA